MGLTVIYGRKAVLELLRAHPERVHKVSLADGVRGGVVQELMGAARAAGVRVQRVPRQAIDRKAHGGVHQGVLAETHAVAPVALAGLLTAVPLERRPILVACDGITDPHNLGAIARSAAGAGAVGLLVPSRETAPLTPVARKASAGALDRLPVAAVGNLAQALRACKEAGFWVVGTDVGTAQSLYATDLTEPFVLVLGREGSGLRPGILKLCDITVSIPMAQHTESLNVSVAAGVVLFEAVRQRRARA